MRATKIIIAIISSLFLAVFLVSNTSIKAQSTAPKHEQTVSNGASGSNTISVSGVTGGNRLYVLSVAVTTSAPVTSVNGLGLSWSEVVDQCTARGGSGIQIWRAVGNSSGGTVTVQLGNAPANATAIVSSYSGVNSNNPIGNVVALNTEGTNGSCSGGVDNDSYTTSISADANTVVYSAASIRLRDHTNGDGFVERIEVHTGSGGETTGLAVQDQTITSADSGVDVSGSLSSDINWAVGVLEIKAGSGSGGGGSSPDANGDGKVDGLDYVIWLSNYNRSTTEGPRRGDFNVDGTVNGLDYVVWVNFYGRTVPTPTPNTPTPTPNTPTPTPNTPTPTPNTPTPTPRTPTPTSSATSQPTLPPDTSQYPCGLYPNAKPGCMPVSYQSWFDNVPASATTMNVSYTPRLIHQHYECSIPQVRRNGQYKRQAMDVACQLIRYNHPVDFIKSNSSWTRTCDQGSCYDGPNTLSLGKCQNSKYEGKECKTTELIHPIPSSVINKNTEVRMTPNLEFAGLDNGRHFISANWQTGIGYRNNSELTNRYWIEQCGDYQRTILRDVDKFFTGNETIPTVSGTIQIPLTTNGGCGTQFKTFVFLNPGQHTREFGSQTGQTLMEVNSHFSGNFTWDTTKVSNGVQSLLFINMEGTSDYVSASGISLKFNVQN